MSVCVCANKLYMTMTTALFRNSFRRSDFFTNTKFSPLVKKSELFVIGDMTSFLPVRPVTY